MGDSDPLLLIGLALAPVIFIFTLVYVLDYKDREPITKLLMCFVFGVLIAIPVIFMELFLQGLLGVEAGMDFTSTLIYAVFVIAFSEELLKFFVLRVYAYRSKYFDEPYDGIMYAVAVSLGFAGIENILYVLDSGLDTAYLRMFTAVPGHAMMAIIMGYYVGKGKFAPSRGKRTVLLLTGLLAAVAVHGAYDFFLMWQVEYIALLAFVVLIVSFILSVRAMRIHKRNSPHINQD